jgi:hypothetical protein
MPCLADWIWRLTMATPKKRKGLSKQRAFLAGYVRTASITKAAKAAKIDRSLHYRWLLEDEEYKKAFAAAYLEAGDLLEDEAVRRANEGIEEPLVYQGEFSYPEIWDPKAMTEHTNAETGEVTVTHGAFKRSRKPLCVNKKSDPLLMFLLKGFKSDKYRDRVSAELSGVGGGPIALEDARLKKLSDDELAALIDLAQKIDGV